MPARRYMRGVNVNLHIRLVLFVAAAAICTDPGTATAEKKECGVNNGQTPYAIEPAEGHEHDRYSPAEGEIVKRFGAYVSSFDGGDDDDGDGAADLLAVLHWVSYELKGVTASADGRYREPPVSINGPRPCTGRPSSSFSGASGRESPSKGSTRRTAGLGASGTGATWRFRTMSSASAGRRLVIPTTSGTPYHRRQR